MYDHIKTVVLVLKDGRKVAGKIIEEAAPQLQLISDGENPELSISEGGFTFYMGNGEAALVQRKDVERIENVS